jgi:ATP-dependent helicase/nuclease subunit A
VLQALENTLADPRGRWLLDAHAQAVSELDLGAWRDGRAQRRVIDRSFVDPQGQRWIVDFKTGTHEGGDVAGFVHNEVERYRGQLQEYCMLMRQLDPAHPVRAALYLPLLADAALRWVELDV